ncbi:MAG: LemA family protein, partial [Lentisphaerae bacterium]|nr:LemA family protein [Lentisphaerota bacterium]
MKKGLLIALGVIVLLVMGMIGIHNGLIRAEENVTQAWANVESVLQRRY